MFTRPVPKSAKAQVKILLTRTKDSARNLADRLGVSIRTVERYRAGKLTKPQKRLQAALVEATESEWQPQVREQAREQAAISASMMVHVVAYFGFTARGSSVDGCERHVTTAISRTYAAQIPQPQEADATEQELHPIVAQAITESHFTDWGTRCQGLAADFTHVQSAGPRQLLHRESRAGSSHPT